MQSVKTMPEHICKRSVKMKISMLTYCGDKENIALDTQIVKITMSGPEGNSCLPAIFNGENFQVGSSRMNLS